MNMKNNQKRKSIGERLKGALENITVDVFGYEKKVTTSVTQYIQALAKEYKIPPGNILARITKHHTTVRVFLYYGGQPIREIPVKELVTFFTGDASGLLGMEKKVVGGVTSYIDLLTEECKVHPDSLQVRIRLVENGISIKAFENDYPVKVIEVKELIKHFRA